MTGPQALHSVLSVLPQSLYAVIDRAKFSPQQAITIEADIHGRSLFLAGDQSTAPFLAELDEAALHRLLAVPRIEESCVFWVGDVAEIDVFDYLRRLNLVTIPRPEDAEVRLPGSDSVLFRHWDPSVLSIVYPVMEPAQQARLFGQMSRLIYYVADQRRVIQAAPDPSWPAPVTGLLRFSVTQMQAIEAAMATRSHAAIAGYLRETAPGETAGMTEPELRAFVASSEIEGRRWGLVTEAGQGRFAWLMLRSDGRIVAEDRARHFVLEGPSTPDDNLRQLMEATASVAKRAEWQP